MTIKDLMEKHHTNKTKLSRRFGIPYKTLCNWETEGPEHRQAPEYVVSMMDELLSLETSVPR